MKSVYLVVFVCFFTIRSLHAFVPSEVCTVDSLDRIYQEMPHLDEHSLVVFDRDDTLLQGIDYIGPELRNQFISSWKNIYAKEKTTDAHEGILLHNIQTHMPILVDSKAPSFPRTSKQSSVEVTKITLRNREPSINLTRLH